MANIRVIMNDSWGTRIFDALGLKQGDHLSSMLFLLIMEVLNALIKKADNWSLFQPLGSVQYLITHLFRLMI
jgi:hypothetical protein